MNQQHKYPEIDWTKNEYHQLTLIVKQLQAVLDRDYKRHEMNQELASHTHSVIEEVISMLNAEIDYDPTDEMSGESSMTADEMHTAAWHQHQEMHK